MLLSPTANINRSTTLFFLSLGSFRDRSNSLLCLLLANKVRCERAAMFRRLKIVTRWKAGMVHWATLLALVFVLVQFAASTSAPRSRSSTWRSCPTRPPSRPTFWLTSSSSCTSWRCWRCRSRPTTTSPPLSASTAPSWSASCWPTPGSRLLTSLDRYGECSLL